MSQSYCYVFSPNNLAHGKTVIVKIGSTGNPNARLRQLQEVAYEHSFFAVWFSGENGGEKLERELHAYYAPFRINRELFRFTESELFWLRGKSITFFECSSVWTELRKQHPDEKWPKMLAAQARAKTIYRENSAFTLA